MYMLKIIGFWENEAKKAKPCPKNGLTQYTNNNLYWQSVLNDKHTILC